MDENNNSSVQIEDIAERKMNRMKHVMKERKKEN